MSFVVDASVILAWMLPGERHQAAANLVARLRSAGACAPDLLMLEVANALLTTERRGRITGGEREELTDVLARLPLILVPVGADQMQEAAEIASWFSLSTYDASYLALAMVRSLPIATFDTRLVAAAASLQVQVAPIR